jgi:hypothetical protein
MMHKKRLAVAGVFYLLSCYKDLRHTCDNMGKEGGFMVRVTSVLLIGLCGVLAASDEKPAASAENNPQFHSKLLEIAKSYSSFGRVDDEARWAPWLCRTPNPSVARFSESKDEQTHGQKLYFLFAKERHAYVLNTDAAEQIVVKESWVPKKASLEKKREAESVDFIKDGKRTTDFYVPFAEKDGEAFHAETKSALFIMYKLDAATPGTDHGWVYGTVSPDGKQVTAAGTVSSCMKCHEEAPHGRLFGLARGKSK